MPAAVLDALCFCSGSVWRQEVPAGRAESEGLLEGLLGGELASESFPVQAWGLGSRQAGQVLYFVIPPGTFTHVTLCSSGAGDRAKPGSSPALQKTESILVLSPARE